ncbi:MAG: hypothetical protein REI11_11570 [Patulibacter sp.]|nr:hypothetical protein [Patulibacter sp.]
MNYTNTTDRTPQPSAEAHEEQLQRAYERGRRDALGAYGAPSAEFEFRDSMLQSIVDLELGQLGLVHEATRVAASRRQDVERAEQSLDRRIDTVVAKAAGSDSSWWRSALRSAFDPDERALERARAELLWAQERDDASTARLRTLTIELEQLRAAVDRDVAGTEFADQVAANRREPQMPPLRVVSWFASHDLFVEASSEDRTVDPYGHYGDRWRIEDAHRPWEERSCTILWNPTTKEAYARFTGHSPKQSPVWLLGKIASDRLLVDALQGFTLERMAERNSLVWAAEQIAGDTRGELPLVTVDQLS